VFCPPSTEREAMPCRHQECVCTEPQPCWRSRKPGRQNVGLEVVLGREGERRFCPMVNVHVMQPKRLPSVRGVRVCVVFPRVVATVGFFLLPSVRLSPSHTRSVCVPVFVARFVAPNVPPAHCLSLPYMAVMFRPVWRGVANGEYARVSAAVEGDMPRGWQKLFKEVMVNIFRRAAVQEAGVCRCAGAAGAGGSQPSNAARKEE